MPGDTLYIVAKGGVEVINDDNGQALTELGGGQVFGEIMLLSGGRRTATLRCKVDSHLLAIDKSDFDRLLAEDPFLGERVRKLSHERAISNLRTGAVNPAVWAQLASENLEHLSRGDEHGPMHGAKGGKGVGLAIVFATSSTRSPAAS